MAVAKHHNINSKFMKAACSGFIKMIFAIIMIAGFAYSASAQSSTLKSRVAIVSNENKTSIWVSDFPKKTSVVILDSEYNLLSVISTNDYGAAYLSLPAGIKSEIIAKTLNGEIVVSNKPVIKNDKQEQNVVSIEGENSNKI